MPDIKLIEATPNDVELIGRLATLTWNQHYPAIISHEQIDYMLKLMYNPASLREQMLEKGHTFYIIKQNGNDIGFISVNPEKETEGDWFMNKFYIDQNLAAKGNGTRAFDELIKIINPARVSLTVNRQNYKSVNFYFKLGFKIERVADFDIGNGYVMNDFVMVWVKPA